MPSEMTIPESQETLALQVDALKSGRAKAVLVTHGEEIPELPKSLRLIESEVGEWIFNPLKIKASRILEKVEDGTYHELLGHVEPKSEGADQTVTAYQDGVEAKSSVVSAKNLKKQFKSLKKQFPKAEIVSGGPEQALRVLEERINAQTN